MDRSLDRPTDRSTVETPRRIAQRSAWPERQLRAAARAHLGRNEVMREGLRDSTCARGAAPMAPLRRDEASAPDRASTAQRVAPCGMSRCVLLLNRGSLLRSSSSSSLSSSCIVGGRSTSGHYALASRDRWRSRLRAIRHAVEARPLATTGSRTDCARAGSLRKWLPELSIPSRIMSKLRRCKAPRASVVCVASHGHMSLSPFASRRRSLGATRWRLGSLQATLPEGIVGAVLGDQSKRVAGPDELRPPRARRLCASLRREPEPMTLQAVWLSAHMWVTSRRMIRTPRACVFGCLAEDPLHDRNMRQASIATAGSRG